MAAIIGKICRFVNLFSGGKLKWDPEKFEYAFQVWFKGIVEEEMRSKTFRVNSFCKSIGLELRRFSFLKKPGSKAMGVYLRDIIKLSNGLNMSPSDILKAVTDEYKKIVSIPTDSKRIPRIQKKAM